MYRLYGLALAVLTARMQFEKQASANGQPGLLFLELPHPGRGRSYPWTEFTGPLRQPDGPPLHPAHSLRRDGNVIRV